MSMRQLALYFRIAFRSVGRATYSRATGAAHDTELLKKVAEILERAAKEIDGLPR